MFRLSLYKPQAYLGFESIAVAPNNAVHESEGEGLADGPRAPIVSHEPVGGDTTVQVDLEAISRRLSQIITRLGRRRVQVERRTSIPSDFELS